MAAAAWSTGSGDGKVSRDEAQTQIQEMAEEKGIKGTFKVFYDGRLVADPEDLPERVDMDKVEVSAVLDQA